jgi:hypothetical protein
MKFQIQKNWVYLLLLTVCSFFSFSAATASVTSAAKHDLSKYFDNLPWLGLIADEVTYGPITISHIHIHEGDKLVVAAPEEVLKGSLKYKIKTGELDALHRYHLVIGIKGKGAQDCLVHSLGVWDTKGKVNFKLTAPKEPGVYEVRFLFVEDLTCAAAQDEWNSGKNVPGSNATIGAIIIE